MSFERAALTLDLGNTRVKLCRFASEGGSVGTGGVPGPLDSWTIAWDALERTGIAAWLRSLGDAGGAGAGTRTAETRTNWARTDWAAVTSVAGPERTAAASAALAEIGLERVLVAPDSGLENTTRTPETVGHDRLYAARGALERVERRDGPRPRGCLVVDAGTALTVDALALAPVAPGEALRRGWPLERARFLGGAIAPGPELLAEALARRGAQLPAITPREDVAALGRDTLEALQAGVVVGFRGAAEALLRGLRAEAELGDAPLFVTGGARRFLLEDPACLRAGGGPAPEESPWLVEEGLLAAAREALA